MISNAGHFLLLSISSDVLVEFRKKFLFIRKGFFVKMKVEAAEVLTVLVLGTLSDATQIEPTS